MAGRLAVLRWSDATTHRTLRADHEQRRVLSAA
jgi:hypothetical protein